MFIFRVVPYESFLFLYPLTGIVAVAVNFLISLLFPVNYSLSIHDLYLSCLQFPSPSCRRERERGKLGSKKGSSMAWGISVGAQNWGVPLLNHNFTVHKKMSAYSYVHACSSHLIQWAMTVYLHKYVYSAQN